MTKSSTTVSADQDQELAGLRLGEMGALGDTLAEFEGGRINVFGGIPGEEVEAAIIRYRRRRRYRTSGIVTRVLKPSPHRVATPCPYYGPCSGCQWQHIDYGHQLVLKRRAVQSHLGQYAELADAVVADTLPSPNEFGYRNHARFTARRQGTLGFSNRITRRFVKIDRCMLMSDHINDVLGVLQGRCAETTNVTVRHGINTGDSLIQPTLQSDEVPLSSGQLHYTEQLLGREFRVSSPSFFQTNTVQAEALVELVRQRLELTGAELLVDAYAGVGTFAVLLAPHVRRVVAIEESDAAVKDAAVNTLGLENLEFRLGKVEKVLDGLHERPDAVILDPSRVGCHPTVLEALIRSRPRRVVYVSCDPESLARDLSALAVGGFSLLGVEPVDMFPQTYHVECVATLVDGT